MRNASPVSLKEKERGQYGSHSRKPCQLNAGSLVMVIISIWASLWVESFRLEKPEKAKKVDKTGGRKLIAYS